MPELKTEHSLGSFCFPSMSRVNVDAKEQPSG